ncbi:hypothetical protein HY310_01140 [Candidatus Microgenomates bacterium]|nr:hypothetical protein [Candidatus Microgenomates bacterium]
MTNFFDRLFTRYPNKTRRALEILPGFIAWTVILFPLWGSFFIPTVLAYFILFFDLYWFYKSSNLVVNAFKSSKLIEKAEKIDWYDKAQAFVDCDKVQHVLIIPNYKEKAGKGFDA